jgi:hypothetical protein
MLHAVIVPGEDEPEPVALEKGEHRLLTNLTGAGPAVRGHCIAHIHLYLSPALRHLHRCPARGVTQS